MSSDYTTTLGFYGHFKAALNNLSWADVLDKNCPNAAYDSFWETFSTLFDIFFPFCLLYTLCYQQLLVISSGIFFTQKSYLLKMYDKPDV